jgi:hypothetical protein
MKRVFIIGFIAASILFSFNAPATAQNKPAKSEEIVDDAAGYGEREVRLTLKLKRAVWNGVKPLRVEVIVENSTDQDILYDMRCKGGLEGSLSYQPFTAGNEAVIYTIKFDSELRKRANCNTIRRKDCDVIPARGDRVYTLTSIKILPGSLGSNWKRHMRGVYTLQIVRDTGNKPLPFRGDSGPGLSQVVHLRIK